MSSLSQFDRRRPGPPKKQPGWALELFLAGALALRCVPTFTLEEDTGQGGDPGSGGESGAAVSGTGGSSGGSSGATGGDAGETTGGGAGATSGAGGDGDAGAGRPGGEAGDSGSGNVGGASSGSGGTSGGGASGGIGGGGTGGAGSGGVGGASGAGGGASGSGGNAGSGGSGVVRACGSGGAPYVWANWCMPNHPGQGPHPQSYDTSTPGIVKDLVTGLVWEHPTNGTFAGRTFAQADTHCADLRTGGYGGFDDWRVPSIIELVSITDYAVFNPAFDATAFPGTPANENFWTSQSGGVESWIVSGMYGVVTTENPGLVRKVRCVR